MVVGFGYERVKSTPKVTIVNPCGPMHTCLARAALVSVVSACDVGDVAPVCLANGRPFHVSMVVAGMLHILHNLVWLADSNLSNFEFFLKLLKQVVLLFDYKHSRRMLVTRSVVTAVAALPRHLPDWQVSDAAAAILLLLT